ncbi:hypothetical protein [Streptomyces sp. UG1]|uniref:hypothetical protein n=1 Tax=Streptomyces sp. UG1 TaxID=3417652 RepID=UPI003CEAD57F
MNAEVISLKDGTPTPSGITCSNCARNLEPDWILWTGTRHLCGQCIESNAYDRGYREALRRLGANDADVINAHLPLSAKVLGDIEAHLTRERPTCPLHDDSSLDMAGGCTCDA